MLDLIRREPALVAGLLNAVVLALSVFVWHLSPEQIAAIMGVATAVLAVVVRSQVTPTVKLPEEAPQQLS